LGKNAHNIAAIDSGRVLSVYLTNTNKQFTVILKNNQSVPDIKVPVVASTTTTINEQPLN